MDDMTKEIEDLIRQANDPTDKAMLLLVNRLSVAVESNLKATERLTERFETHVEREETDRIRIMEALSKSRNDSAWYSRIAAALQVVIMSVVGWHLAVHDDLDGRVNNLEQYREGHIQHHQVEERRRVRQLTDNLDG
jgi:hypothetical protein